MLLLLNGSRCPICIKGNRFTIKQDGSHLTISCATGKPNPCNWSKNAEVSLIARPLKNGNKCPDCEKRGERGSNDFFKLNEYGKNLIISCWRTERCGFQILAKKAEK